MWLRLCVVAFHSSLDADCFHERQYSSCWYETGNETLGQAEVDMINIYVERGEIKDGMEILDLG